MISLSLYRRALCLCEQISTLGKVARSEIPKQEVDFWWVESDKSSGVLIRVLRGPHQLQRLGTRLVSAQWIHWPVSSLSMFFVLFEPAAPSAHPTVRHRFGVFQLDPPRHIAPRITVEGSTGLVPAHVVFRACFPAYSSSKPPSEDVFLAVYAEKRNVIQLFAVLTGSLLEEFPLSQHKVQPAVQLQWLPQQGHIAVVTQGHCVEFLNPHLERSRDR